MSRSGTYQKPVDRLFLSIVFLLSGLGYIIFLSASLGSLGYDISSFTWQAGKQLIVLLVGLLVMLGTASFPYHYWRKLSVPFLALSAILTLAVFVPGLGVLAGGASRWLDLGVVAFQPVEILKFGLIIYYAVWLANTSDRVDTVKWGLGPLVFLVALAGLLLIFQPDTGSLMVISAALVGMFFVAGGRFLHLFIIAFLGVLLLAGLVVHQPYIKDRFTIFLNPSLDTQGLSYQINQSFIAIGAGELTGRGFGQSLQKFSFLPQPVTDSIFAVVAEEFGFIGAMVILALFVLFALMGFKIAARAPDNFGRLLVVGIVILIASQSFVNIGAMLGVMPLTGIPLVFVSHGGSSLLMSLFGVGIILNVSRHIA